MEETPWSVTPKGLKPSVEKMFHYLLSGIMISRDKKEILPFLPEKRSERVYVDMTPSQRKAYNEMHKELETTLRVIGSNNEAVELVARTNGSKFTKLRRLSLDPGMYTGKPDSNKTEYILDFCVDAPEKVVVFSWYKDYVDLLHTALLDKGINAVKMHGGLPDRDNDAADRSFKKDPNIQVIVGTIAKMGEGFDYPMATTVIFADTSYIPDDNRQGEERIWRPGQTKECRIIYLVTRKSVDEIVHKKVLERQDIVDEALAYKEVLRNISGVVA
jgi:SNF2 family DNA or RNA helicase